MSSNRKMNDFFLRKTNKVHTTSNLNNSTTNKNSMSLFSDWRRAVFYILAFFYQQQRSRGDTVYALELSTNTGYQVDFNPLDFPHIKTALIEFCKAVLYDAPQTIYGSTLSLNCSSQNNPAMPGIGLSVAVSQNLTLSLQSCFNETMIESCNEYYAAYSIFGLSREMMITIGSIIGFICMIGCVMAMTSNHKISNTDSNSYGTFNSPNSFGPGRPDGDYVSVAINQSSLDTGLSSSSNSIWSNDKPSHHHDDKISIERGHHQQPQSGCFNTFSIFTSPVAKQFHEHEYGTAFVKYTDEKGSLSKSQTK